MSKIKKLLREKQEAMQALENYVKENPNYKQELGLEKEFDLSLKPNTIFVTKK